MKREKTKQDPGYIIWLNRLAVAAAIAAIAEVRSVYTRTTFR